MGVSRNIDIIVYTNIDSSYNVMEKFLVGFWLESKFSMVNTFYEDDTDDDILPKEVNFDELEELFKKRANMNKLNTISFLVEYLGEGIIISINTLENTYNDEKKYNIWISPGGRHTLEECERNTNFSFYLNLILPRLKKIGCYPSKIVCVDSE